MGLPHERNGVDAAEPGCSLGAVLTPLQLRKAKVKVAERAGNRDFADGWVQQSERGRQGFDTGEAGVNLGQVGLPPHGPLHLARTRREFIARQQGGIEQAVS